jgi:hypothetical protein
MRTISWFSCGASSAVATKLALKEFPELIPVYCDTHSEHPDNERFLIDCQTWFGKSVIRLSGKYRDIWDVFEKTRYLVGPLGARCTVELKKIPRLIFCEKDDVQIFGFTWNERKRAERFLDNNFDVKARFPLIEQKLSSAECLDMVRGIGIALPCMYALGYEHNNCIGCVKGGAGYWNKIRKDFPGTFTRMAGVERRLKRSICKINGRRIYLDELPLDAGEQSKHNMQCGLFCGRY